MTARKAKSEQSPPTYTVDALAALEREVQIAADRRLLAALTVSGACVPDVSPPARHPGVPQGSRFLEVQPRFDVSEVRLTNTPSEVGR